MIKNLLKAFIAAAVTLLMIMEWMYVLQVFSVLEGHQSIELVLKAREISVKFHKI